MQTDPLALHDQAERCRFDGDFAQAAWLFDAAARVAYTVAGQQVLIDKAREARQAAEQTAESQGQPP